MKTTLLILVSLALAGSLTFAQNQGGPRRGGPGGGPGRGMPMDPVLKALDTDTNGVLVATEISNAPAALKTLDKNTDGALSAEEMTPQAPEGAPAMDDSKRPRFASPIVKALDKNSDGILSAEEIAGASTALTALDKNSDGQLTRQELMPGRPGGPRGGKAPGEPEPASQDAPITE
jgi:hypothetical protein